MQKVALFGVIGTFFSGVLLTGLFILNDYYQHQYQQSLVMQIINVPDQDSGRVDLKSDKSEFYWREVTLSKKFDDELAVRLEGNQGKYLPRFEAGIPYDEIAKEAGVYGRLTLWMYAEPIGQNFGYSKNGQKLKNPTKDELKSIKDHEIEFLRNQFKVGRDLFLEKIAIQGVPGTPKGEIKVLQIPFKPLNSNSDLIDRSIYPFTIAFLSGLIVLSFVLAIIYKKAKSNKSLQPTQ